MKKFLLAGLMLLSSTAQALDMPYYLYDYKGVLSRFNLVNTVQDIYVKLSTFVDMSSKQTVGGDKTFTGTNTFTQGITYGDGSQQTKAAKGIVQVVQGTMTAAYTTTSTSFVIPTGLSATITPVYANSKIMVMVNINMQVHDDTGHGHARLQRDGNALFIADAAGTRARDTFSVNNWGENGAPAFSMTYIDTANSTASTTYSVGVRSNNGTTVYMNRSVRDADDGTASYDPRTVSNIVVMEIAQ
jgi:hypothetical protein